MELQKFDSTNAEIVPRRSEAFIGLHKSAASLVSQGLADIMGLQPGDGISFFQDKKDAETWYLQKDNEKGFKLRANNSPKAKSLLFNCVFIARKIMESIDVRGKHRIRCMVAREPVIHKNVKYFTIITASAKEQED